jgi:hypothetical protein
LIELLRQPLRGDAPDDVDLAAGRETDQKLDRMRRIGLGAGQRGNRRQREAAARQTQYVPPSQLIVIPGPSEARSPESITTAMRIGYRHPGTSPIVVMDSGPVDFVRVPE